jgi:uncharacterized phage-associated protein
MTDAIDVADFFIDTANAGDAAEDDGVTNMKLNKLLFFAQAAYLQKYEKPLFSDPIQAWQYGPVVNSVYHTFKPYHRSAIDKTARPYDYHIFSPEALDVLTDTYIRYAEDYTATALMKMTHQPGTPWKQVYKDGIDNLVIPLTLIRDWVAQHPVLDRNENESHIDTVESDSVNGLVIPSNWDE